MSALIISARNANSNTDLETKVQLFISVACTVLCIGVGIDMFNTLANASIAWGF